MLQNLFKSIILSFICIYILDLNQSILLIMNKTDISYQIHYLFNKGNSPKQIKKILKQSMCKRFVPTERVKKSFILNLFNFYIFIANNKNCKTYYQSK